MFEQIFKLAEENKAGFTVYIPSLDFVKHGWVIANMATQNMFGKDGLTKVIEFAMKHNRILGGYMNTSGIFQFDASIVEPNEQRAIALMLLHDQDCIYNLNTKKIIWNDR